MTTPPRHLLFILSTIIFFLLQFADSKTYWKDIHVLHQLKSSIAPSTILPGSCISSWDFSLDPCDSLYSSSFTCGFTCDSSRITEIALDQAGYSACLSSVPWSSLSSLRSLDVSGNNFSGPIPESISRLGQLQKLVLSRNSLSGPIPGSLDGLSGIQEMYLDGNGIQGAVPRSLGRLTGLQRLEIQGNKLSGEFPDVSGMTGLYFLDASDNGFSGRMPIGFPASIVEISMRNNYLEGGIPEEIGRLGYLQVLDLSNNRFAGTVPASLFAHPSLQQLTLANNRLSGVQVPIDLGTRSGLIAVDLSGNELGGLLPGFMGLMPKLSALSLENNRYIGLIPTLYGLKVAMPEPGVAPFERLLLGGNYLVGPIPGLFMGLKPGTVNVNLVDNCLFQCPAAFFFCQGGEQKPLSQCRSFAPVIP
ncbi:hypothetical protein Droror1_Dr00005174 [Drosera rotundifolia]